MVLYFAVVGSNNGDCFPSMAKIKLEDGTLITMFQLQIGDNVQTGINFFVTKSENTSINKNNSFSFFFNSVFHELC